MYAETLGCMYADCGCMSIKYLGACMRKRLGAKYESMLDKYLQYRHRAKSKLAYCQKQANAH